MKSNVTSRDVMQNCSLLSKKEKRSVALQLKANFNTNPEQLYDFLEYLLAPTNNIKDPENIEWCRWLMAGGLTPDAFAREVKKYDNATTCGLVWTANFVAYRCRTCGVSPCMSLCAECFQKGNHEGHDFNMFRSQAGGACDCGDIFVMKESGFCGRHGPQAQELKPTAPVDLLLLPHAMMPRLIFRLMHHLRSYNSGLPAQFIEDADRYLTMLQDFSALGAAVRTVMTQAITDTEVYKELTEWMDPLQTHYQTALETLGNPSPPEEFRDCPSLQEMLVHKTFLEELMFWTVKLEFPQKIVCLLLNMLPDPDYKEALTRSFVLHYSRIPMMLEKSSSPDTLSNRVVHVSVQLFSNEGLALRMTEQLSLLHVMVISLKYMMSKILIPNTLHNPSKNFHFVVDCGRQVMKEHCYWPLVSDLNNVLSHRPVALKFMGDGNLLEMWFTFLSMFQGMNVNQREMSQHVEFEPSTYYAAFSAELEASAYPMWALVSHLKDSNTVHLTRAVLNACVTALQEWFEAIDFHEPTTKDYKQVSFHLPLHRYLAILMSQAVKTQGVALKDVLPPPHVLELVYQHPLRLQVAFYEILNGMWVRNGLQIKGQMMTYIQCNFCNSMVDADLYLLQVCATQSDPEKFLLNVIKMFRVSEALSIALLRTSPPFTLQDQEFEASMLESCLTFIATLVDIRSNLGASDAWLSKLEMVTLLCMGDKTHSQLMELMPERCGTTGSRDFDTMLAEVADYRAPANMQQGMYAPKSQVWENLYDPIHVLLRAVHRKDFQTSMDRFTEYVQQTRKLKPGAENIWPPLRPPSACGPAYDDPRKILQSRVFHAAIFCILYQAAERRNMSEHVLALAVYLLEMAIMSSPPAPPSQLCNEESCLRYDVRDMDLTSFYESDWLALNLRTVIVSQINTVLKDSTTDEDDIDLEESFFPELEETMPMQLVPFAEDSGSSEGIVDEPTTPSDSLLAVAGSVPNLSSTGPQLALTDSTPVLPIPRPIAEEAAEPGNSAMAVAGSSMSEQPLALPPLPLLGPFPPSTFPLALPSSSSTRQVVPSARGRRISSLRSLARNQSITPIHAHYNALFRQLDSPQRGFPYMPPLPMPPPLQNREQQRQREPEAEAETTEMSFSIGESIISLLLKLHAALSGTPDSYQLGKQKADGLLDSRIGDGAFFVAKVLDRIADLDDSCRQCIEETMLRLWPKRAEEGTSGNEAMAREALEREDRRRRAKERQQKLMEEFANRQKQFMEKTKETEDMEWTEESEKKKCEYDCVICNQSSPSSEDQPMGLVVLIQTTSVLGHMRPTDRDVPLPTSEAEISSPPAENLAHAFGRRVGILENFESWQQSVNVGWELGLHLQTCGHHLHMDCLASYLQSLKGQQRPHSPAVDKGEYLCPLCRQLANSVLPLAAQLGELTAVVRARPPHFQAQVASIGQQLTVPAPDSEPTPLSDAMDKSLVDMKNMTRAMPTRYTSHCVPGATVPTLPSSFLFATSVARTNLEVEMVQKGGTFLSNVQESPLIPKRSCLVPLLHVLSRHARLFTQWPTDLLWRQLTEAGSAGETSVGGSLNVPLLLADPSALLIHLLLLLPLSLDQSTFSCLVKCIFNLLYFQVLAQISLQMTVRERDSWRDGRADQPVELTTLDSAIGFVLSQLEGSILMSSASKEEAATDASTSTPAEAMETESDTHEGSGTDLHSRIAVEALVQKLCLPFLRVATLLRHHLFAEEIPQVRTQQTEFVRLVYYLELVTEGMDWNKFNASVALNLPEGGTQLPITWLIQLIISQNWCNARSLMLTSHVVWHPPRLLTLPQLYDKIFQFYHARQCMQCSSVPREASLCLLCGTLVCLKENCCKRSHTCEAVQHAMECGAGTGMFLVVTSSYVIVIRGKRACLWGSVYLDSFGEEDRELKRGKPLYLCSERYRMLQEQWLAHRFDHTSKKWVWHREAL